MTEDFEREERAFAEALRGSVPVEPFRPLDPEELKAVAGPAMATRGRWLKGLAAAAAVVVVAGAGVAILPGLVGVGASETVAALPEAAGGAAPMEAQDRGGEAASANAEVVVGDWETVADSPLTPRSHAVGAWLDGEFYLIGGQNDPPCPPAASCIAPDELLRDGAAYNPGTDTWRRITDAPVAVSEGLATVAAGRLYVQRGFGTAGAIYSYEPASDSWSPIPRPAQGGVLVALGDRLANVVWSTEVTSAHDELYDPASRTWTRLPADPLKKSYERTLVWVGGKALLFAKDATTSAAKKAPVFRLAELDLATGSWRRLPDSEVVGIAGDVVGQLVVFPEQGSYDGGEVDNWGRAYPAGGIYDPATGAWSSLPTMPKADGGLSYPASTVAGGVLLSDGGLLDPVDRRWIKAPEPPDGNLLGQAVVTSPDGILVFGGWDGKAATNRAHYLPLR